MRRQKGLVWVECPGCRRKWLVSTTVDVEIDCYCGTLFVHNTTTGQITVKDKDYAENTLGNMKRKKG